MDPRRTSKSYGLRAECHYLLLAALAVAASIGTPARADNWPAFRGAEMDGTSKETGVFKGRENLELTETWKVRIGSGYSGIAVADGHVVTMFSDGTNDVAVSLAADTGEERWRFEIGPTYEGHDGSHTGPIATPLIAGGRVFGLGPRGALFALDLATGAKQWSIDLQKDFAVAPPFYGYGTSPVMHKGVLVIMTGSEESAMVGLNPESGEKLWSAGKDAIAYQTPVLHKAADNKTWLVGAGNTKVFAVSPADGSIGWEYGHAGGGGRGSISLVPVAFAPNRFFLAHQDKQSQVIEVTTVDGQPKANKLWESRSIRNSYNVPVYYEGHLYAYSSRFLTCVEAETGESVWKSRQPGDGFLILVDGHLVIQTKKGTLHVAKASPSGYQEVAAIDLFDDVAWTHPSFSHNSIYTRSMGEIIRANIAVSADAVATSIPDRGKVRASKFWRFVLKVNGSQNKKELVDKFIQSIDSYPHIEGEEVVHFIYRGPGEDLALAGDMFGARREEPMNRIDGTDMFYYSMRVRPNTRMNYVFMRDYETIPDPKNPHKTATKLVDEEMEMSFSGQELEMSWFAMPRWKAPPYLAGDDSELKGRLESHELESEVLAKKHTIDVYLPPVYDESELRFPTVYVHGGAAAVADGVYGKALDHMAAGGTPMIAVFLKEPSFRQADKYVRMVGEEVVMFVDGKYRTQAAPKSRASVGAGFAGVDAWHCALEHPDTFGAVGSQSMFMFDSFSTDVKSMLKSATEQPLRIYVDWGEFDFRNPHEAWDMGDTNDEFATLLRDKGYNFAGGQVSDGTGWSSWKNRTDRMLASLFAS